MDLITITLAGLLLIAAAAAAKPPATETADTADEGRHEQK